MQYACLSAPATAPASSVVASFYQEWTCDQFCEMEKNRLAYIRFHQDDLRTETMQGLHDGMSDGKLDAAQMGRSIILPGSVAGSP